MPEDTKKLKILMILGICVIAAGFGLWGVFGNKFPKVKVVSSGKVNIGDWQQVNMGNSLPKVKFA